MNRTKIEWVKNPDGSSGYTWNPITGCLNHDNGLCKSGGFPCYAYKLANGRVKPLYLANHNVICGDLLPDRNGLEKIDNRFADPFYPRFWEDRLHIPEPPMYREYSREVRFKLQQKHRKGIFVCDMSDLFGIGIPKEWTSRVMSEVRMHPEHRFYLLTKQPQNLIKFSPFPDNCWVGVTATNGELYQQAMIYLDQVKATTKYISFEPLLDRVQFFDLPITGLDWLIIGACTGSWKDMARLKLKYPELSMAKWDRKWTLQPKIEWVREIVEAADKAGIPVFLKDNLEPLFLDAKMYWKGFYGEQELRQELPNG